MISCLHIGMLRMKPILIVLIASLALNVWVYLKPESGFAPLETPEDARSVVTHVITTNTQTNILRVDWKGVESTNFFTYIARLREIGCPEKTVKDIIIAEVDELFAPRYVALTAVKAEYWQPLRSVRDVTPALEELEAEKAALVFELLGVDLKQERLRLGTLDSRFAEKERNLTFLPPEKRAFARKALYKFDKRTNELLRESRLFMTQEEAFASMKKMGELQNEFEIELAEQLTHEEILELEKRTSNKGATARAALLGLDNPSAADFNALYDFLKLREKNNLTFRGEALNAAAEAAEKEFQTRGGDALYDAYMLSRNPTYQPFVEANATLKLPVQTIRKVVGVANQFKNDVNGLKQQNLPKEQMQVRRRNLELAAENKVRNLIGDDGFRLIYDKTRFLDVR